MSMTLFKLAAIAAAAVAPPVALGFVPPGDVWSRTSVRSARRGRMGAEGAVVEAEADGLNGAPAPAPAPKVRTLEDDVPQISLEKELREVRDDRSPAAPRCLPARFHPRVLIRPHPLACLQELDGTALQQDRQSQRVRGFQDRLQETMELKKKVEDMFVMELEGLGEKLKSEVEQVSDFRTDHHVRLRGQCHRPASPPTTTTKH